MPLDLLLRWSPSEYVYRDEDYPETAKLIDDSTRIQGIWPQNYIELMELYAKAFRKIFDNLDPVIELPKNLLNPFWLLNHQVIEWTWERNKVIYT